VLVYLSVDGQPALRQGLFARGRIETAQSKVLALPLSAVRSDLAQPYVLVIEGGKVVLKVVQLGMRGEIEGQPWMAVTSGVAEGAVVLAGSAGAVRDGTPVRMASNGQAASPASGPAAR
jgi:hypothetical protein